MKSTEKHTPVQVLHVLGSLDRGGTESWLMALFREFSKETDVKSEVIVQAAPTPESYGEDARNLGLQVHTLPRDLRWFFNFYRFLRAGDGYDVVHSHRDSFSAFVLLIAWIARVPTRIAHSHSDRTKQETRLHALYRMATSAMLRLVATDRVAVSKQARDSLFAVATGGSRVVYCGIDLARFQFSEIKRAACRQNLDIAESAPVLIHVGNLRPVKNHEFLLRLFASYTKAHGSDAYLILLGSGDLEDRIRLQAEELGIASRLRFLGSQPDVETYLSAADLFVFPSFYEGLSLSALEAQAAGLPMVQSNTQTSESVVEAARVRRLGLEQPMSEWVDAVTEMLDLSFDRTTLSDNLEQFDIKESAAEMLQLYTSR